MLIGETVYHVYECLSRFRAAGAVLRILCVFVVGNFANGEDPVKELMSVVHWEYLS